MEALHETMKANPVNEQLALAQLDKVLDAEREIKRLHFGLAIRIKNKLTAEQQEKLHGMMRSTGPCRWSSGRTGTWQRAQVGPADQDEDRGADRGPGPGGPGPGPGPGGPPPGQRTSKSLEP